MWNCLNVRIKACICLLLFVVSIVECSMPSGHAPSWRHRFVVTSWEMCGHWPESSLPRWHRFVLWSLGHTCTSVSTCRHECQSWVSKLVNVPERTLVYPISRGYIPLPCFVTACIRVRFYSSARMISSYVLWIKLWIVKTFSYKTATLGSFRNVSGKTWSRIWENLYRNFYTPFSSKLS